MIDSPPCRHPYDGPKVAKCKFCAVRDGRLSDGTLLRDKWAAQADAALADRTQLECKFRGERLTNTSPALLCTRTPPTPIPLYACAIHGSCTLDKAARKAGCCRTCGDKQPGLSPAVKRVGLDVTANGIGDLVTAMSLVAGWKKANPGRKVVLTVRDHLLGWADLFADPDEVSPFRDVTVPLFWRANNTGQYHFVEAVAVEKERALPTVKPVPPESVARAAPHAGAVVLAPFALGGGAEPRTWLMSHWVALEAALQSWGVRTVIIGAGDVEEAAWPLRGEKWFGRSPQDVVALMKVAACVVANESGMAHLAGAIQVPCVVVAAQLDGKHIHGFWPKTTILQGPLPCSGCRWRGPHFREACHTLCAALQMITPEDVLLALGPHVPELGLTYEARLAYHLERLIVHTPDKPHPTPDRRPTVKGFLERVGQTPRPLVVETGCQRQANDYGAGMSSTVFGLFLASHGGQLVSLDLSPENCAVARYETVGLPVQVVTTDSVKWLKEYTGSPFAGAYLDSMDTYVPGYADHCLAEAKAVVPHLLPRAAVLIDDTWWDVPAQAWRGKGEKAVPWLMAGGWVVIRHGYQVLLTRPG